MLAKQPTVLAASNAVYSTAGQGHDKHGDGDSTAAPLHSQTYSAGNGITGQMITDSMKVQQPGHTSMAPATTPSPMQFDWARTSQAFSAQNGHLNLTPLPSSLFQSPHDYTREEVIDVEGPLPPVHVRRDPPPPPTTLTAGVAKPKPPTSASPCVNTSSTTPMRVGGAHGGSKTTPANADVTGKAPGTTTAGKNL